MSSWPEGTRNRLLFSLFVGVGVTLLMWFGLITPLQARLGLHTGKTEVAQMQLQLAQASLDKGPLYRALVEEKRAEIAEFESRMAEGEDLLGWEYQTLVPYEKVYGVMLRGWESPRLGVADVPPDVPYAMATFGVTGQGHYHSIGMFLAGFENSSPFVKLRSLSLQALTPGFGSMDEPEQLSFRMEYHILAQTNTVAAGR
jgi:Tfp pilus assembly protein PilO